MCHIVRAPQKAKKTKAQSAETGGDDDDEDMITGSSNGSEPKRGKKKEKLVLKKPQAVESSYKQWYKSYMITVTTAPLPLTLRSYLANTCTSP